MAKKKKSVDAISDEERAAALSYLKKVRRSPGAERDHAESVLERHQKEILAKKGVLSADVGIKTVGGAHTHIYAICIYVEKKAIPVPPRGGRAPRGYKRLGKVFVPRKYTQDDLIPEDYEGVPTDIIEGGVFDPVNGARPMGGDKIHAVGTKPDVPGGNKQSAPGTLGCGVLNKFSKRERYLTCAHVLTFLPKEKSPEINSKRNVLNAAQEVVGTIDKDQGQNGDWAYGPIVDCAVVLPTEPRDFFQVPVREEADLQPRGMRLVRPEDEIDGVEVWTRGAITGERRTGNVTNVCGRPMFRDGTRGDQQIMVKPGPSSFAVPGDSGGIVCVEEMAIGIVRAVNDHGVVAVCPLMTRDKKGVADLLNLSFDGIISP